jgi:serine/threonine protein kinase
MMLI